MRVLHFLEAIGGGTARHLETLVEKQAAAGYEIAVVMPPFRSWGVTDTSVGARMRELGVPVFSLRMHRIGVHPFNLVAAARVVRIVRRWRPNVIHTHSTVAGMIGRPAARAFKIPTIYTPNGLRFSDIEPTKVGAVARLLERVLVPFTTRVVAASESEGAVLRTIFPAGKVAVVPNGIDPGGPPPELPERFRVVAVSRLDYQKDPDLLVRVLAGVRRERPEVEAVIVGWGKMEAQTRQLIAELDPAIVISDEPGIDAIASASVLLLTSRWEGAPYVLLEAMDLGRPVVATDVVGSRDIVADAVTGLLFPWGDAPAGTARLIELVDDLDRARGMGRAGRQRLEAEFSLDGMAAGVERVYEDALNHVR